MPKTDKQTITVIAPMAPNHGATIAKALGGSDDEKTLGKANIAIFLFPHPKLKPHVDFCRWNSIKTIGYWIGSDSYRALFDIQYRSIIPTFDVDVACHQRLAHELNQWQPKPVKVVNFLAHNEMHMASKAPAKPNVGVYMPSQKGKYGFEWACEIASAVPNLTFTFYGAQITKPIPTNVQTIGKLDQDQLPALMETFSCGLRLTAHDGLPQTIIELKLNGKHCVTTYPYPNCIVAKDTPSAVDALQDEKTHQLDHNGRGWYLDNCTHKAFANAMFRAIEG